MILHSFVRDTLGLSPVDVEVVLQKGLPKIEVLGLPDRGLQESLVRIQAAIVHQGFEFPRAHKVVVNIRPIETKKSSLGLELSIALAILHLTGQKRLPEEKSFYVYGELSLSGEVKVPKDLELIPWIDKDLITGPVRDEFSAQALTCYSLSTLSAEFAIKENALIAQDFSRPELPKQPLQSSVARLIEIVAVGEHSLLLAGPSGTGKTTLAQMLLAFLREPTVEEWWSVRRIGKVFNENRSWRPSVMPHHSISVSSMLGGGNAARPGAIFKAHHGILVLDELLEFSPLIQSALREPIEQKSITVSKNTQHKTYESSFLTVGATNLCRCGAFVPGSVNRCRCTSMELRRYVDKLSGPFLDRFSIFEFTHLWKNEHSERRYAEQVLSSIERGVEFSRGRSAKMNDVLTQEELVSYLENPHSEDEFPKFRSWRRYLSFLRVGRTIADLDQSVKIKPQHLREAYMLTAQNFNALDGLYGGH